MRKKIKYTKTKNKIALKTVSWDRFIFLQVILEVWVWILDSGSWIKEKIEKVNSLPGANPVFSGLRVA